MANEWVDGYHILYFNSLEVLPAILPAISHQQTPWGSKNLFLIYEVGDLSKIWVWFRGGL